MIDNEFTNNVDVKQDDYNKDNYNDDNYNDESTNDIKDYDNLTSDNTNNDIVKDDEDGACNDSCNDSCDDSQESYDSDENTDDAQDEKLDIELNAQVVEALLFANGEELTLQKLQEVLEVPEEQILFWIEELTKKYNSDESSFELVKSNSAYQLRTKDTYSAYIRRLKTQKPRRLSNSALETLAVIAYKQPIMKSEIERIRGVDASPTIKTLITRNLIKIIGHADKIGQPALYATTDDFLKVFNLNSLADLPNLREVVALSQEPEEMPEEV